MRAIESIGFINCLLRRYGLMMWDRISMPISSEVTALSAVAPLQKKKRSTIHALISGKQVVVFCQGD